MASIFFTIILANLKLHLYFLAGRCSTLLGRQSYKIFSSHLFCFGTLPCEVTLVQKFHFFCHSRQSKKTKLKQSLVQSASLWIANWCQSEMVLEVSAICTNTFCTSTPLAYCYDCDRVVHLSPFSSAFCLSTTTTTQSHNYVITK